MRLFIAIPLVSGHFHDFQQQLMELTSLKATFPHEIHLTMKFIGDVSADECVMIKHSCRRLSFDPFPVQLTNIGFFPDSPSPRIVWQGIAPNPRLSALHDEIDRLVPGKQESKPFCPHLTLMRIKWAGDKEMSEKILQIPLMKPSLMVDRLILFASTLTSRGPVYEEILVIPKPR